MLILLVNQHAALCSKDRCERKDRSTLCKSNSQAKRCKWGYESVSRSPHSFCLLSSPSHAAASPSSPRVPSLFYFCLSSSVRRTCVFSCPLFQSCSIPSPLSLPFLFLLILKGPVLIQHSSSNLVLCPL